MTTTDTPDVCRDRCWDRFSDFFTGRRCRNRRRRCRDQLGKQDDSEHTEPADAPETQGEQNEAASDGADVASQEGALWSQDEPLLHVDQAQQQAKAPVQRVAKILPEAFWDHGEK